MSVRTHVKNIFVSRSLAYEYALHPLLCNERHAERSACANTLQRLSDMLITSRSTNRMRCRGVRNQSVQPHLLHSPRDEMYFVMILPCIDEQRKSYLPTHGKIVIQQKSWRFVYDDDTHCRDILLSAVHE